MSISELSRPLLASTRNGNLRTYTTENRSDSREFSTVNTNNQDVIATNFHVCDKVFLVILFIVFCLGVTVGFYLLATEGHEWRKPGVYNITSRKLWKAHVPLSIIPNLTLPVQKVLFLQTNDSNICHNNSPCTKVVQELQQRHMVELKQPDIMYNFVVSYDGTIFEGRGWNFQSSLSVDVFNDALTVAFLEECQENDITRRQIDSMESFLQEAVHDGKLKSCIEFDVWSDSTGFNHLAKNIRKSVSDCNEVT